MLRHRPSLATSIKSLIDFLLPPPLLPTSLSLPIFGSLSLTLTPFLSILIFLILFLFFFFLSSFFLYFSLLFFSSTSTCYPLSFFLSLSSQPISPIPPFSSLPPSALSVTPRNSFQRVILCRHIPINHNNGTRGVWELARGREVGGKRKSGVELMKSEGREAEEEGGGENEKGEEERESRNGMEESGKENRLFSIILLLILFFPSSPHLFPPLPLPFLPYILPFLLPNRQRTSISECQPSPPPSSIQTSQSRARDRFRGR